MIDARQTAIALDRLTALQAVLGACRHHTYCRQCDDGIALVLALRLLAALEEHDPGLLVDIGAWREDHSSHAELPF